MEVKITFEEGDFNRMHDVLYELTGHQYTHEELEVLWHKLPQDIKDDFIHWGGNDTCVGDALYEYYEKIMKQKGLKAWED